MGEYSEIKQELGSTNLFVAYLYHGA